MAAGTPVVSTELGTGTSWVNQDGVTGRVVPPGDPGALARAIREILDDPRTRAAWGDAGRRRVADRFTADRMVTDVLAAYRELLERTPDGSVAPG
jgi:rhamnosyl/mannosyltransferase